MDFGIYERFEEGPKDFSLDWLKEKENRPVKFIQVYSEGKPYIRVGEMYHKRILEKFLQEKGWFDSHSTWVNGRANEIPVEKDDNYEMVGAGKIGFFDNENKIGFYDISSDYEEVLNGANRKHLEDFFGKENVFDGGEVLDFSGFLVNFE